MLRYTKSHYLHQLNATPNYDHLGHPINAYHLIRHVASGWNKIVKNKVEINKWVMKNSKKEHWRSFPGHIGIYLLHYLTCNRTFNFLVQNISIYNIQPSHFCFR